MIILLAHQLRKNGVLEAPLQGPGMLLLKKVCNLKQSFSSHFKVLLPSSFCLKILCLLHIITTWAFYKDKASGDRILLLKSTLFDFFSFLNLNQKCQKQLPMRVYLTSTCPSWLPKCPFVKQTCPFIEMKIPFPRTISFNSFILSK